MDTTWPRGLIARGAVLVLGAANHTIVGKEPIKRDREVVYPPLAPVDPRSLMPGDYMALSFAEGTAERSAAARCGEFGVYRKCCEAVPVGLLDAGMQPV